MPASSLRPSTPIPGRWPGPWLAAGALLAIALSGCLGPVTPVPQVSPTVASTATSTPLPPTPTFEPTPFVPAATLPAPTPEVAIGQLPQPGDYALEAVAGGLDRPVGLTHSGDGSQRIFLVEKPGLVRILSDGNVLPVTLSRYPGAGRQRRQ